MSFWSDLEYEVPPVMLDQDTADRLLAGAVAPEDAPPGYAGVARLLDAAARAEPTAAEAAGEPEMVATMARVVRSSRTGSPPPRRRFTRRTVAAGLVFAGLAGTAGLASAGALPGAIQDFASGALDKVGITVPGRDDDAASSPNGRRESLRTPATGREGASIAAHARDAKRAGARKVPASSAASPRAKTRTGQHASASGATARPPLSSPPGDESSAAPRDATQTAVTKGAAISARASRGKRAEGHRPISRAAPQARPPTRGEGEKPADTARKRNNGDRGGPRSGSASGPQQGPPGGSGGHGGGNPGNPGQVQPASSTADGGPAAGSSANGNSGRSGRP
jgi:translation initiation factor IF-2